jgi:hypothetical protein
MKAQSEPDGQQITDCTEALLSEMHAVFLGQQKDDGKPFPHCWRPSTPPHIGACRGKRLEACAVARVVAKR